MVFPYRVNSLGWLPYTVLWSLILSEAEGVLVWTYNENDKHK